MRCLKYQGDRGIRGNFACGIQMKVPIAGVSVLFTKWRYLAVRGKYDNMNLDILQYEENMTIWIFGLPYFPAVKFHAKLPLKSAGSLDSSSMMTKTRKGVEP